MIKHEVYLGFDAESNNSMGFYGPSEDNLHILEYHPEGCGTIIMGENTKVQNEPFYMNWRAVCEYLEYHNERIANASNS
jgi:hypothetical protein